jgi:chain length determinant protein tyrosine kinase EpsG
MEQSNVIPVFAVANAAKTGDRSIGAILVQAGRLSSEDAERILRRQREKGLRFGEAAMELGLLKTGDIEFALSRQFDHPYLVRGESKVSEEVVAAYAPFGHQSEALRALRGQLMLRWFDNNPVHKALAIVSADRKEGRSFLTANLGVVFSQLGMNTLVVDADMRNPSQHRLFGLNSGSGFSEALSGRGSQVTIKHVAGLPDLWLLPAGALPPNPVELLARPRFPQLLAELAQKFSVILLDSPAAADCADAQTIAVRAGAALIVARKNKSRVWQVSGVSDVVGQASTIVIGSVLNDF